MIHQFQHFSDFDRTVIGGPSKLNQWVGKTRRRYNAFVNHANKAIILHSPGLQLNAATSELIRAIDEIKRLAKLRLYELQRIEEEFDVNDDGPGSADFICCYACEFLYGIYRVRTDIVIWQCLMTRFPCVHEPQGMLSQLAPIISNRGSDKPAWHAFCAIVEDRLHEDDFANLILGENAHSQFLASYDETLYDFQQKWIPECGSGEVDWCAPIFSDSPEYGYHGSTKYSLRTNTGMED